MALLSCGKSTLRCNKSQHILVTNYEIVKIKMIQWIMLEIMMLNHGGLNKGIGASVIGTLFFIVSSHSLRGWLLFVLLHSIILSVAFSYNLRGIYRECPIPPRVKSSDKNCFIKCVCSPSLGCCLFSLIVCDWCDQHVRFIPKARLHVPYVCMLVRGWLSSQLTSSCHSSCLNKKRSSLENKTG